MSDPKIYLPISAQAARQKVSSQQLAKEPNCHNVINAVWAAIHLAISKDLRWLFLPVGEKESINNTRLVTLVRETLEECGYLVKPQYDFGRNGDVTGMRVSWGHVEKRT